MASSLEELLAKEGFKGSRRMTRSRSSFQSAAVTEPLHSFQDQPKRLSVSSERNKTERTKSDVLQYRDRGEFSKFNNDTANAMSRKPMDILSRKKKMDEGLKIKNEEKSSSNTVEVQGFDINSSIHMPSPRYEITEITEVSDQEDNRVKHIYSNEVSNAKRGQEKIFNEFREKEKRREIPVKDAKVDRRHGSSSRIHMPGHITGNTRKNIKQQENSCSRSNSKSFENNCHKNLGHAVEATSNPALDEVAVQAVVSILNGYIKRFLKDEDFRTTLRHNCFSSLDFIEVQDENSNETKIITSLEQAIETLEQAAEESVSTKNLKRASMQLSIITGLSLNDLKNGLTCGIPNYKLSACAHLYLSVIYKMQRKDKVSAKHLLQVFCDSPCQSRTTLLPELWQYLFSPHLSHLKAWYDKEAGILTDTPSRSRKLKLLKKVYNENLDSGTYLFAVYYKDWLTDGVGAPSVPSIRIPSISVTGSQQGSSLGHSSELASSVDPFSPHPMVSKKLYDSVFSSLGKPGIEEDNDYEEEDNLDNCMSVSYGSAIVKQGVIYASETFGQDIQEDFAKHVQVVKKHPHNGTVSTTDEEEWGERSLSNDIGHSFISPHSDVNSHMLDALPHTKANEFAPRMITGSVLEAQNTKSSFDPTVSTVSLSSEESGPGFINPIKISSSLEGSYYRIIPQEFICPLTGTLFDEPVTLETGQTFERAAIKEWFEKGNRTCPMTGNALQCVAMPLTNLILKRLVDNWKSEEFSRLLDFASQITKNMKEQNFKHRNEAAVFKLESLFSSLNEEDKTAYAKLLISLGIPAFLLERFEMGNVEEKTCVVALLLYCIEADSGCIYRIARNMNKKCLHELLHSKEITPRTNAILLLTELLSMTRRKDVTEILSRLTGEDVFDTMHILLVYLRNSQPHQKPLVAVLLLHFDLLAKFAIHVELKKYSINREEAIIAITMALDASLNDEKVRQKCCRALSIMGGHFSFTGEILTKTSILKLAGYNNDCSEGKPPDLEQEGLIRDGTILSKYEEERSKEWLMNFLESLIGDGESPFLKAISKCLDSRHLDLVTECLIIVTWLSSSLATICHAGLHLPAFLAVISRMKAILENGELELKTLASMSLFNFSKISECRTFLITMAEDIAAPLHRLADVTWTAKQLHAIVSGEDL